MVQAEQMYKAAYAQGYNEAYKEIERAEAREREREAKKQKIRERKKQILIYYLKQKLVGLVIIVLGVLSVLPERDVTAAVLMVPAGIWIALTKERVLIQ